jgi:hypothetical protein
MGQGPCAFLLEGINQLPFGYVGRIQNFLTEYLGTKNHPEPFGGREAALAELDRWLESGDKPYLLLTAPAGRGKSALLVRWLECLQRSADVEIVFVPASVRFNTNLSNVFFACLAARLAHLFGEPVPARDDTPWRGLIANYLSRTPPDGRQLLVVLDALDEAGDWQAGPDLLPFQPPAGVRVVVSARSERADEWLQRLGWQGKPYLAQTLDLAPLSKEGVQDVLVRMGCPLDELGARVDIVYELYRLSEGDPLLVHLYVEDLWNKGEAVRRLKPEDLGSRKSGYESYIDGWWKDQRILWGSEARVKEREARALLNLLAVALGPIRDEDMCAVDSTLDGFTIELITEDLKRFVIRNEDQGYVFGHPKLREYFANKLTGPERRKLDQQILAWGRRTLDELYRGEVEPKAVSPYLIRHLGTHLLDAKVPLAEMLRLVHKTWSDASLAVEGAYASFLQDVLRVRDLCMEENARLVKVGQPMHWLAEEIRCGLVEASLHSLAGNISPELLAQLVSSSLWTPTQALVAIQQKHTDREKAVAFIQLAAVVSQNDLVQILSAARAIQAEGSRARVLIELAQRLPEERLGEVLEAARRNVSRV